MVYWEILLIDAKGIRVDRLSQPVTIFYCYGSGLILEWMIHLGIIISTDVKLIY